MIRLGTAFEDIEECKCIKSIRLDLSYFDLRE